MNCYHLDYETFSACDITNGAYRYASDPSTRILLCAITYGDNPPLCWDSRDPNGEESRQALRLIHECSTSSEPVWAHNSQFELAVSTYHWETTFGCPPPAIDRWRCTAAMCRRAAIPWSLAGAAEFLNLPHKKDKAGGRLIQLFSIPPTRAPAKDGKVTVDGAKTTEAEAWEMFKAYCRRDVEVERELHHRLKAFDLKGEALESFLFDLRMNHVGVPVDVPALVKAQAVVEEHNAKVSAEFTKITGLTPSQTVAFTRWIKDRGYPGDDLTAASMEEWAGHPAMTQQAQRALALRAALSFAAVKKIDTMLECVCPDGTVKGSFMWYGAVRTGRWSGRLVQFQNVKRPAIKRTDIAYDLIAGGAGLDSVEALYGNPLEAIASIVRNFVRYPEHDFIDTDLANIEGRVAGWIAGDEELLADFRAGVDVYKVMAGAIYSVDPSDVTPDQRTTGKIAVLSCIAEGQMVKVPYGQVPIESLTVDQSVWDGVSWVSHEGIIEKGERHVIEYQGLVATPDHEVFVSIGGGLYRAPLWAAAWWGIDLAQGHDVQPMDGDLRGEVRQCNRGEAIPLCTCQVPVWTPPSVRPAEHAEGVQQAVRAVPEGPAQDSSPRLADETHGGCQVSMSEPRGATLRQLRGEGGDVRLPFGGSSSGVGCPKYVSPAEGSVDRPGGQQQGVRPWEPTLGHPDGTNDEHSMHASTERFCVRCGGVALQHPCGYTYGEAGPLAGADSFSSSPGGKRETKVLETYRGTARTFDVLNCGPFSRFTVSGKLVHNCGYGTGWQRFQVMASDQGHPLDDDTAKKTIYRYRKARAPIVSIWRAFGDAAVGAIREPGATYKVGDHVSFRYGRTGGVAALTMMLPNGRRLVYPDPRVDTREITADALTENEDGEIVSKTQTFTATSISFYGQDANSRWTRIDTHGSKLFENCCQATAGGFLSHGLLLAAAEGYEISSVIHDQALAKHEPEKGLTLDKFLELLTRVPEWAPGFPLKAEAHIARCYSK